MIAPYHMVQPCVRFKALFRTHVRSPQRARMQPTDRKRSPILYPTRATNRFDYIFRTTAAAFRISFRALASKLARNRRGSGARCGIIGYSLIPGAPVAERGARSRLHVRIKELQCPQCFPTYISLKSAKPLINFSKLIRARKLISWRKSLPCTGLLIVGKLNPSRSSVPPIRAWTNLSKPARDDFRRSGGSTPAHLPTAFS